MAPKITIHCVRHAQGYHNLSTANHALQDPDLTPFGQEQCADLRAAFPYHDKVTHLVASPLRRTLYTCLLGFPDESRRGLKVIALPEIQETSGLPCDTGSDPAKLHAEFDPMAKVDLSHVEEGWNSKTGRWAAAAAAVEARARDARIFLRELAKQSELEEVQIVVVTHGGFLHYFTEDWDGSAMFVGTGWTNTEFRSYEFAEEADADASLKETEESLIKRRGEAKWLSKEEQTNLKLLSQKKWRDDGFVLQ